MFNEKKEATKGQESQKVLKLNRLLSSKKVIATILIVENIIIFAIINYITNIILNVKGIFYDAAHLNQYIGLNNLYKIRIADYPGAIIKEAIIILIAWIIMDALMIYRLKTSFSEDYFNVGQKGTERWTSNEEIKAQYIEVPDRDKSFPGYGGTIVSRIGNKLYLDDSNTNNLIIGITRSGKGEMFVFPSIDVYSRAEKKTSLVIADPKLELYKSSKKTLEARGYDVYLLNFDDPLHSMGFNPLEQITELYVSGDYANAELLTQSFSYSIFNPSSPTNTDAFWQDTASSLLSAMILAHLQDCIAADELANEKRRISWEHKRQRFENLDDEKQKSVRSDFNDYIQKNPDADTALDEKIKFIPPESAFKASNENVKKINMYSIINTFTELATRRPDPMSDTTALDLYFNQRPALDRAKLKYAGIEVAGSRTKGGIYASMLAKLTIFTYENIAKMTAESSLKLRDIGFGNKPVAIFMGMPDYDKSTYFLATVFVRQTYFVLAKEATRSMTGKCKNRVKFILDEFGNIPAIESMETIITVCLGRNISFDMFIQSYAQVSKLYGDDSETIIDNCGNQIYILTDSGTTAQNFSELLGNQTMIDLQRSGERLSTKKHVTETTIEKPLLNKNQLMQLREGECVVKRVIKRRDRNGNRIEPTPIFNSEKSGKRFLYRYEYLQDTFPNPDGIDLYEINNEDRSYINLRNRVWNPEQTFTMFTAYKGSEKSKAPTLKDLSNNHVITDTIMKLTGERINDEISVINLMDLVGRMNIKDGEKQSLYELIRAGEQ